MKRKKIAVLLVAAMVTSGVAAPVEGVLASDEIQIQSEESVDVQAVTEETVDTPEEGTDVAEEAGDSFADSTDFGDISEGAELSDEEMDDISVDAEESESEEVEISEENLDTDEITADEFTDGETAAVGESGEVIETGMCGDTWEGSSDYTNVNYRLYADGRLVFDGNGAIDTQQFREDSRIKSVQVSEGITSLGSRYSYLFMNCKNLTSVMLPESLTNIGEMAFYGCENLKNINIPSGLTSIGRSAFNGCKSLSGSINIPTGVTSIESYTFYQCEGLSSIVLPDGLTSIGENAFYNCKNLTSIHIPDGVTSIENSTFENCEKLKNVNIPAGVTSIGVRAFDTCESLESVTLPENLTSIKSYAFLRCKSIESLVIPDKLTSTDIGDGVFAWCSNLRSVTLPKGLTSIRKEMFSGCSRLTDIVLPESVTEIEARAFSSCSDLTELALPKGLTTIGDSAFSSSGLLSVSLPEGLKSIGASAFASTKFTDITLPNSLADLGESALSGNSNLESITIPDNITELKKTFSNCWRLKTVSLPAGLQKMEGAFSGCNQLETITIPDNVTVIGDDTFRYCYKLKEVHLPKKLIQIGYEAFYGCEELANISLPEKLENIDTGAFKNCPSLLGIYIPSANVQIKSRAIGYNSDTEKNEKLVLISQSGSSTEKYAKDTGIHFHNITDSLTHQNSVSATCVKDGNVEYWHCDTCGQNFSNAEGTIVLDVTAVAKLKHKKVYVPYKEATCTTPGNTEYYHCETCGKNFENSWDEDDTERKDVTIPAKGHDWQWRESGGTGVGYGITHGYTQPLKLSSTTSMERICWRCNQVAEKKTVKKTLNVNVDQITLKCGQSSTAFRVSGDPIKSVVANGKLVTVSGVTNKGFKVTANSKMTGNTTINITTTTGLSANVLVFVQKGTIKTKNIRGLAKSVSVVKGKTVTLKPTLEPVTSPEKITYSSSNKKVATVSANGVVKGVKAGTAKITVKSGSKTAVVTVKVTGVKTTKLSGVPTTKTVARGKSFKIKAVATPKNTDEKITYTSSNKKIVTVTAAGVVKGLRKGTVTITVRSGSKKMICKVTVK